MGRPAAFTLVIEPAGGRRVLLVRRCFATTPPATGGTGEGMHTASRDSSTRYFTYVRLMISGPGAWQVGMISMRLMFMCGGRPTAQAAASAMSSAVSGTVPA